MCVGGSGNEQVQLSQHTTFTPPSPVHILPLLLLLQNPTYYYLLYAYLTTIFVATWLLVCNEQILLASCTIGMFWGQVSRRGGCPPGQILAGFPPQGRRYMGGVSWLDSPPHVLLASYAPSACSGDRWAKCPPQGRLRFVWGRGNHESRRSPGGQLQANSPALGPSSTSAPCTARTAVMLIAFAKPFPPLPPQLAFIGHDVGHRCVHATRLANDILGLVVNAFLGIGVSHWVDNHNAHHAVVNSSDCDPEVQVGGTKGQGKGEAWVPKGGAGAAPAPGVVLAGFSAWGCSALLLWCLGVLVNLA